MAQYIETKLRYEKMADNGTMKKVTEKFLLDALSFTEAEARIIEERAPFISGEFEVAAVKKTNIDEVLADEVSDHWYQCRVNFVVIDEKSGQEKQRPCHIIIQADTFHTAVERLNAIMKDCTQDFTVASISETDYLEVYRQ